MIERIHHAFTTPRMYLTPIDEMIGAWTVLAVVLVVAGLIKGVAWVLERHERPV